MNRRNFVRSTTAGLAGAGVFKSIIAAQDQFQLTLDGAKIANANWHELNEQYMLDDSITYLNHASIGTMPKVVFEAHRKYLEICESNPWLHMWGDRWQAPREIVRKKCADCVGAAPENITLIRNVTEAFNLLAHGLNFGPSDEVLFSSMNHVGASATFVHEGARRGFKVRRFEFPAEQAASLSVEQIVDYYRRAIRPETRVLVLPHVDNGVGLRHPLAEISAMARQNGVDIIGVDAAQTVGMIPIDVVESGVDLFATSTHKWLQSPKGLGFAYISPRLQEILEPIFVTWGNKNWNDSARQYEDYGTRNFPELLALGDAIDFHSSLDEAKRDTRLRELWRYMQKKVSEDERFVWRSSEQWNLGASLVAIELTGLDSREVFSTLYREHGFVFRAFHSDKLNVVRLSPNVFTTTEDLDRFFEAAAQLF